MGKIGIITFHFAENFGASLQCFALYNYIREHNGDCIIINYRPDYHSSKYNVFINPFDAFKTSESPVRKIKIFTKRLLSNSMFIGRIRKKNAFSNFLKEYCEQTALVKTAEELVELGRDFSVCIAGSDQIWNEMYTNGSFDSAYFLRFFSGLKYTYAASAGYLFDDAKLKDITHFLTGFRKISVRETSLMEQINEYSGLEVITSVDPTLLLNRETWENVANAVPIVENYILVYQLESSGTILDITDNIQKATGLQVVNISPNDYLVGSGIRYKRVKYCSPIMFLSYVRHSQYVVTNSFHGTVFSIIFERTLACVLHSRTPERMKTLLADHGLEKRIYTSYDSATLDNINYNDAKKAYWSKIDQSKRYLDGIIERANRINEQNETDI